MPKDFRRAAPIQPSRLGGTFQHLRANGIASNRGGNPHQQGPRVSLRQPANAAAPSGGRELHEVSNRGGHIHREEQSPPAGATGLAPPARRRPSGGGSYTQ